MARTRFTPGEAQEICECLQTLIDTALFDQEARERLDRLTWPRILAITRSFIRKYPGVSAEDAIGNSRLRIVFDLLRNGRCYLQGLKHDADCKELPDVLDAEGFIQRAERFVNRAVLVIKSDLKNLWKKGVWPKEEGGGTEQMDEGTEQTVSLLSGNDDFVDAFQAALKALPARQEQVVRAILLEEKKRKVLAKEMGISEVRICQLYTKGVDKLAAALQDFRDEDFGSEVKALPSRKPGKSSKR